MQQPIVRITNQPISTGGKRFDIVTFETSIGTSIEQNEMRA
jgi:hypothetical protein